jgi:hypothetical protein
MFVSFQMICGLALGRPAKEDWPPEIETVGYPPRQLNDPPTLSRKSKESTVGEIKTA